MILITILIILLTYIISIKVLDYNSFLYDNRDKILLFMKKKKLSTEHVKQLWELTIDTVKHNNSIIENRMDLYPFILIGEEQIKTDHDKRFIGENGLEESEVIRINGKFITKDLRELYYLNHESTIIDEMDLPNERQHLLPFVRNKIQELDLLNKLEEVTNGSEVIELDSPQKEFMNTVKLMSSIMEKRIHETGLDLFYGFQTEHINTVLLIYFRSTIYYSYGFEGGDMMLKGDNPMSDEYPHIKYDKEQQRTKTIRSKGKNKVLKDIRQLKI